MLRHPRRPACAALLAAFALALTGCGIKGPLVSAPKPESAAPANVAKPGESDKRTEPKL